VPTAAQLQGDFSAQLGAQLTDPATHNPVVDALGRPILAGQITDPYSTRQVTAARWIRQPD